MEDQTIHLVKGSGPATSANVGTGGTTQDATTTTTASTSQSPGEEQRGFLGSNPNLNNPFMAAAMGGMGSGDVGILRMQQQLMSNPEMMVMIYLCLGSYLHHHHIRAAHSTHLLSLPSLL